MRQMGASQVLWVKPTRRHADRNEQRATQAGSQLQMRRRGLEPDNGSCAWVSSEESNASPPGTVNGSDRKALC